MNDLTYCDMDDLRNLGIIYSTYFGILFPVWGVATSIIRWIEAQDYSTSELFDIGYNRQRIHSTLDLLDMGFIRHWIDTSNIQKEDREPSSLDERESLFMALFFPFSGFPLFLYPEFF